MNSLTLKLIAHERQEITLCKELVSAIVNAYYGGEKNGVYAIRLDNGDLYYTIKRNAEGELVIVWKCINLSTDEYEDNEEQLLDNTNYNVLSNIWSIINP